MDHSPAFTATRFPHLTVPPFSRSTLDQLAKRALDIFAALLGLIVLAPFLLPIVVLIKHEGDGPILYRGRRAGYNGKDFDMLKFRTMRETPESYQGPRVTAQDDPRITPLGRWLRDTKLNELPQLWNVLIGEMSLVGPRPEDPEIVAGWDENVRREVLSVRPGITSPASVQYRNEESLLRAGSVMETYLESILPSKLRLDQLYVRHRSFMLDLDVLFWTAMVLMPKWRTFAPPEELMIFGPIRRLVRRYLNWFVVDTLVSLGAIGLAGMIARMAAPLDLGFAKALIVAVGFSLLFSVTYALRGMYRIAWSHASSEEALELVLAAAAACVCALALNHFIVDPLPLPMLVLGSSLSLIGFLSLRYRGRLFERAILHWSPRKASARLMRERVLIVGSGYAGEFMAWVLSHGPSAELFHVVGFVDDDFYKQGIRIGGVHVLGRRGDIQRLVEKHDVGIIVFAIHNIDVVEQKRVLEICANTKAQIVHAPNILGTLNEMRAASVEYRTRTLPTKSKVFVAEGAAPALKPMSERLWKGD